MENAAINSYWSLWNQLRWRKSLLLICKVLKLFVNALKKVQFQRTVWQAGLVNGNKHSSDMENATINSYWSLWKQLRWRKSLLLIYKVLKLFLNALTCRDKYSLRNRDNLQQPLKMRLSQKQEIFFRLFLAFLKARLNFERFRKKQ